MRGNKSYMVFYRHKNVHISDKIFLLSDTIQFMSDRICGVMVSELASQARGLGFIPTRVNNFKNFIFAFFAYIDGSKPCTLFIKII